MLRWIGRIDFSRTQTQSSSWPRGTISDYSRGILTTCWWHELSQDAPTAAVLGEPEAPQIRYKTHEKRLRSPKTRSEFRIVQHGHDISHCIPLVVVTYRIHQPGMYAMYALHLALFCRLNGLRVCFCIAIEIVSLSALLKWILMVRTSPI